MRYRVTYIGNGSFLARAMRKAMWWRANHDAATGIDFASGLACGNQIAAFNAALLQIARDAVRYTSATLARN